MWSEVELLTNEDTNTVRLGNVSNEENGSGLYQVDTLVKICTNAEVQADTRLFSSNGANWSIVVADKSVLLFDQSYQTVLLRLHFDTDVDAIDVCLDGHFLIVCEKNGNLHLIYVPQKKILLTRTLVQKASSIDKKTYYYLMAEESKSFAGMYHVFLVVNEGFFHITNLALAKIEEAVEKLDVDTLKELQSLIKIDFCSTCDYHDNGPTTALMFSLGSEIHLLIGSDQENVLTHWMMDAHQDQLCLIQFVSNNLIPGVRKMVVVENLLFILDTEDTISIWDLHFLVMIDCWTDLSIHDFELATECGSASMVTHDSSTMKMIMLMKENNTEVNSLQIRSWPSMTVCLSLNVSLVSCLSQTKINMDTIYIVERIYENSESLGKKRSSVVVRCFTEALPENRLSRLLYKHQFEEAEKFAIAFELDLECVYKVKLDFVLEQLASASMGGCGQEVWSELVEEAKNNLTKIADEQYVVDYCLKAPWPTFETAEKMLKHAASQCSSLQIQEALARLATFCSLHSAESFNGIAWIEFLNSDDNLGDILSHLREGDMKGAQLLWLKYEGQIAANFDEHKLEAILGAIPVDLPSQDLCPWFRTVFVPFLRRVIPTGQRTLASWLEKRARNLELTEKAAWPQNGLDVAVLGLPSLWTQIRCDDSYGAEELAHLQSLVSKLHQLLDLHKKYNCKLSLSVFEKGNVQSVAFYMLDEVPAPELVVTTVANSVEPYAQKHNIPIDELLLQYIKDLLERCSSRTTTLFTEWEAKAVAVLNCMGNTDLMVDAVLEIMQKAVIPWSNVIEELVQHYLEMEGPKRELIKESYLLMEIRKLLRSYGIRNFNLSNRTQVMTLIRYILKQDLPTSLDDSMMLAKAYKLPMLQIHYFYAIQLTTQGKIEQCLTFLKKLSPNEAECVIERLISWARGHLQNKDHISEEHKKHQMVIARLMVEALKYLQKIQEYDALKSLECKYNLDMFKAIANLQEDFDIFFSPSDYEDPNIRKQMQEHYMVAYDHTQGRRSKVNDEKKVKTTVVANNCDGKARTSVRRLGRQLQRMEQELWSNLALQALRVGKVEKALMILSELHEQFCNAGTGKVLFTAAMMLCQMLEADMPMVLPPDTDLPAAIHHLACQAITVCSSDLLLDCLELCKCTRLAMDVYHQCQLSDNFGFAAKDLTSEAEKLTFQDVFNEVCIALDPVSVLPVQYEITNLMLPISLDNKLHPLDCSCLSHCSLGVSNYLKPLQAPLSNMLQMLQECSQLELALRVLLNSQGSCLQHITSNLMDMKISMQLYERPVLMSFNACLNEIQKNTSSTLNTVAVALLNKVFNWRMIDCDLAVGLCTLLSETEVFKILWKVIDGTWQNYDKILAVARIGANLCCLYNKDEEQKKFLSVITDAEWGIKLEKMGISIQPVFRQQPEMKRNLIPVLLKSRRITPDIITQYCSAFGLDHSRVINQYITTLLLQQESEDVVDDLGAEQKEAEPLCHADALERVLQLLPMLHSSSELMESLCASVSKLSPYNYERIEVVLKIMQAVDDNGASFSVSQAIGLLHHLKSYKRISPPSDVESTYLLEKSLLPSQLSSSRLPFHLLLQTKHYWKIISPELSEETFPTLLLISKLMKVTLDKLYMSSAVHIFKSKMKPLLLEQRQKGQGHVYNKEMFKLAKTMMKYIHCIQNTEFAAATAHNITQELPPGYEKTQSLKFCLALTEARLREPNLEETSRARAETYLSKLKLQFQHSATENTLMSRQLNSPELMKLTGLPARLIVALYEHGSIQQHFLDPVSQSCPDIHAVVKELAHINNVDIRKIRNMLLEKWICKTGPAVTKDSGQIQCVSNIEEDPDLMRVVYMLQSSPMDDAVRLLGPILSAETWPLSSSGPRLTFCHRTRALLCLVRLVDADTLEAQLQIPRDKIHSHLKCYIFVSQLEALNIPYTLQSFLSSPKEALVKGLWKKQSHEPQAVRLVADLCLEFQVYDPQLWNSLLQKLLAFNMISHLQRVLEAVVAVPALWEISCFSRTWRSTILSPFLSASVPLNPDQQATLYRTFVLVLKCPFLLNLDLIEIANHFAQLNLPAFALGSLLLIPSTERKEQQIQAFLSVSDPVAILEQVDELMNTGELAGIPSQVRESVLKFISKNGQGHNLLKTKRLKDLQQLMVSRGGQQQLNDLMAQMNSHNLETIKEEGNAKDRLSSIKLP